MALFRKKKIAEDVVPVREVMALRDRGLPNSLTELSTNFMFVDSLYHSAYFSSSRTLCARIKSKSAKGWTNSNRSVLHSNANFTFPPN